MKQPRNSLPGGRCRGGRVGSDGTAQSRM